MPAEINDQFIIAAEYALLLTGLVLLVGQAIREFRGRSPVTLATWSITPVEFLMAAFTVAVAGVFGSIAAGLLVTPLKLSTDDATIINSAAFQVGLLAGAGLVPLQLRHGAKEPGATRSALLSGLVTFLVVLPIVTAASLVWLEILKYAGVPAEQQDLLRLFAHADSTTMLAAMIVLATLIAPIGEELLFRGIFFRYLRTRIPKWLALLLPGAVFASLHVDWRTGDGLASFVPLTALAVIFSLAYERTGRIATVMVAHALFNLHTIVLLLAGVTQ